LQDWIVFVWYGTELYKLPAAYICMLCNKAVSEWMSGNVHRGCWWKWHIKQSSGMESRDRWMAGTAEGYREGSRTEGKGTSTAWNAAEAAWKAAGRTVSRCCKHVVFVHYLSNTQWFFVWQLLLDNVIVIIIGCDLINTGLHICMFCSSEFS